MRQTQIAVVPVATGLIACASVVNALPPGRAWTPITRLQVPGYALTVAPRLELDDAGSPLLISLTVYPSDVFAFGWVDSGWVQKWQLGRPTITLWPVQSPPGTHHLVWRGLGPVAEERLFMAGVFADGVQIPDTVARVSDGVVEYSGAISATRRWVAASDYALTERKLRIWYSDTTARWHEVTMERSFGSLDGVAVAATGDSSALIAWAEGYRLHWATLAGTQWTEGPPFPDLGAVRLQFRRRPSGGQWLASAGFEPHANLRSWREGFWSPPETLRCAYRDGQPVHSSGTPDLSRDEGEYPAVVWDAQSFALNTICVCVPTDAGYGIAEELEGVAGVGGLPTVARDRNGDVWVAWSWLGGDAWWIHSHTRPTTSRPRLSGASGDRRVEWTLSEPAPETWWAVLRARGLEPFEEVARVRAGQGLEMSWTDTAPPPGVLRYRIRRESVDIRYLWESATVRVPEKIRDLALSLAVPLPIVGRTVLEMDHAAPGAFELSLFDVQGRVVLRQRGFASGTGLDSIAFDVSDARTPVPNGVYFASVRDASGQVSQAVRLVILR